MSDIKQMLTMRKEELIEKVKDLEKMLLERDTQIKVLNRMIHE